jgi:ribosomal protein L24
MKSIDKNTLLKVGDSVMVVSGGNKVKNPLISQVGRIIEFQGDRVVVQGLNFKSFYKRASRAGEKSTILRKEGSIHLSNVMFYVDDLKRPVRLGSMTRADGTKVRGYRNPLTKEFTEITSSR